MEASRTAVGSWSHRNHLAANLQTSNSPTSGIEACLDDYLPLAPNIYDYWPGDDEDHVEPWKFGEESLNIAPAQMHIDSSVEYHPPELVTSTQTSHEVERSAPHRHYLTLTY